MKVEFAPHKGQELLGGDSWIVDRKTAVLCSLLKDIGKNRMKFLDSSTVN